MKVIQLFQPDYGQAEVVAVAAVLKGGWIGMGPKTQDFESKFAKYIGTGYAVALNSATAALHLALLVAGVGKGDEVIVPSLSFVSTAHAVVYVDAKPVFADVLKDTLCINPADIEKKITKKTKAIIPMHYGGHPADMDEILALAKKYQLQVIEDAAHACGAEYKGKKIGSISPLTCFSFHAVKNLATGDGGMITTNNRRYYERLKRLRWCGIDKSTWERSRPYLKGGSSLKRKYGRYGWYYEVTDLGYKYHMNDIAAALGLVQLKKLDKNNQRRLKLVKRYNQALSVVKGITIPTERPYVKSAHHNYVIQTRWRDKINLGLKNCRPAIATGVHYLPIHLQPFYRKNYPKPSLPVTEKVWPNLLTLPLYPRLTYQQQDSVIKAIKAIVD